MYTKCYRGTVALRLLAARLVFGLRACLDSVRAGYEALYSSTDDHNDCNDHCEHWC